MYTSSNTPLDILLATLHDTVPDLTFLGYTLPDLDDSDTLFFFGVHRNGRIAGGYALTWSPSRSIMRDCRVQVTRFFLTVQATRQVRFDPPEIRELWDSLYLRTLMFPGTGTAADG
jgi:hypothetical protein